MFAIQHLKHLKHLKHLALACVVAAGSFLGLAAAPAHAIDTITCTGSQTTTYNPPITNQSAAVTFSANTTFGPCVSTVPGINGGSQNISGQIHRSCATLLESYPLTVITNWNNGQSSTAETNVTVNLVGALYTVSFTGTITDGPFNGRAFVQQLTAPALDITLCLLGLGDVSTINFTAALEIL